MKYKTLCRLLVKLIAIFFLVQGIATALTTVFTILAQNGGLKTKTVLVATSYLLGNGLVSALVFSFCNQITNFLIPSNRPYCLECGYELTNLAASVCPECGTPYEHPDDEPHH